MKCIKIIFIAIILCLLRPAVSYCQNVINESRSNHVKETLDLLEKKYSRSGADKPKQKTEAPLQKSQPPAKPLVEQTPEVEESLTPPPQETTQDEINLFLHPEGKKKTKLSSISVHGYYRNRNYFDTEENYPTEHSYEMRQDLRVEFSQKLSPQLKYFTSVDGQYDPVYSSDGDFDNEAKTFRLWECYLTYLAGNLYINLGKQAIRWGKGDEVNPTDNFTPEDWTEYLNLSRAERKMPVWMTKLNYSFYPYRLQAIWLPFFVPSRIPEAGSDWEPYIYRRYRSSPLPITIKRPERPAKSLENSVTAIKLTKSTSSFDISLSYAYHYDELPSLHLSMSGIGPPPFFIPQYEVSQRYHRQHTIGSDFETVMGKVGLRAEFAYTIDDLFLSYSPQRPDTIVEKDVATSIVGLDYTFANDIYANVQYLFQCIPDHEKDMVNRSYEDSFIARVSRKFLHDTLLLEISSRICLFEPDYYYEFKCEYDINDSLKATVGYAQFFGPDDGTFGQYDENDQIFANLKYSF
jgi:hypothetical protein